MFSRRLKYAATAVALSAVLCTGCSFFHKEETGQTETSAESKTGEEVIVSGGGNGPSAQENTAVQEPDGISTPAKDTGPQVERDESETELGGIPVISGDYKLEDCIELPDITSIEGKYIKDKAPTREDARIYAMLQKDAHRMDEDDEYLLAEYGDKVNIDLIIEEGEDDLAEGSKVDMDVAVGAGEVDEKIEKTIVGMTLGDEREVTVEDENGKITYKVILHSIARPDAPIDAEIDDALAQLTEESAALNKYNRYAALKREITEKSNIKAYPEAIVRSARAQYEEKYLRGGTLNDYLDQAGMTKAEFKGYEDEYAVNTAKEKLVLEALSQEAGLSKNSEEYKLLEEEAGDNPEDPDSLLYQAVLDRLFSAKTN